MSSGRRIALLVHGAGSTPDAARRLLSPAVPPGCDEVVAIDARGAVEDVVAALAAAATDAAAGGGTVVLVAGISLGAHAVATWAVRQDGCLPDLLLVMPAWTGAPDEVARLTASSAAQIEREGPGPLLDRLVAEGGEDWVVDELVRAWRHAEPVDLARSLRLAGCSPAPSRADLASLRARVAVVALADDPLHPESVARDWAGWIPSARLVVVARYAPGQDRGALGRAGRAALAREDRAPGARPVAPSGSR